MLPYMKSIADTYFGTHVVNAVATVPAYFDNSRRKLLVLPTRGMTKDTHLGVEDFDNLLVNHFVSELVFCVFCVCVVCAISSKKRDCSNQRFMLFV